MGLQKLTVLVLDTAPLHTVRSRKERRTTWEHGGLFLFYLPRSAPHLNSVEALWRQRKYEWLTPTAYETPDGLFYTVRQALAAVGTTLYINFSRFSLS